MDDLIIMLTKLHNKELCNEEIFDKYFNEHDSALKDINDYISNNMTVLAVMIVRTVDSSNDEIYISIEI